MLSFPFTPAILLIAFKYYAFKQIPKFSGNVLSCLQIFFIIIFTLIIFTLLFLLFLLIFSIIANIFSRVVVERNFSG